LINQLFFFFYQKQILLQKKDKQVCAKLQLGKIYAICGTFASDFICREVFTFEPPTSQQSI